MAGRADHRSGEGTLDEQFRMKHGVRVSGQLARIVGAAEITVNSLHEQAIDRLADGLAVEGVAADGTVEAVRVEAARGVRAGRAVPSGMALGDRRAEPGAVSGVCRSVFRLCLRPEAAPVGPECGWPRWAA